MAVSHPPEGERDPGCLSMGAVGLGFLGSRGSPYEPTELLQGEMGCGLGWVLKGS